MSIEQSTATIVANLPKNQILLSSFSLSSAMCLAALGARSDTLEEIKNVFRCNHEEYELLVRDMTTHNVTIANALFPAQDLLINPKYMDDAMKYYDAVIKPQDFSKTVQTSDNVNSFISEKTNGRIEKTIDPSMINEITRAMLVNTLHLEFQWKYSFDKSKTTSKPFQIVTNDGLTEKAKVTMMAQGYPLQLLVKKYGDEATGVVLPSHDNNFSMEFILPTSDKPDAIFAIEKQSFDSPTAQEVMLVTELEIPKFDFTNFVDLIEPLRNAGIKKAFEGNADFSGMSSEKLFISEVYQKSRVTVNENGVAASSAAVAFFSRSMPQNQIEFKVNRPFMAHIRYKDTLLFSMRIMDPRVKETS